MGQKTHKLVKLNSNVLSQQYPVEGRLMGAARWRLLKSKLAFCEKGKSGGKNVGCKQNADAVVTVLGACSLRVPLRPFLSLVVWFRQRSFFYIKKKYLWPSATWFATSFLSSLLFGRDLLTGIKIINLARYIIDINIHTSTSTQPTTDNPIL
jgi:hypothetical protein